jgi:SAM-dependent methyltransferase
MVLYGELAKYWTMISPVDGDDYKSEAEIWKKVIKEKCQKSKPFALELGVGGGNNLSHLSTFLDAWAVDISVEMLENSKRINPGVRHFVGDMRKFRTDTKFDLVMVHDAVTYMKTESDLIDLFETARYHLEKDGLFIASPDHYKDFFEDDLFTSFQTIKDDVVLNFTEYNYDTDPNDTVFNCHFDVTVREGSSVRHFDDDHELGLFWMQDWKRLLEMSGFEMSFVDSTAIGDKKPSYLVVGTLK